MGEEGEKSKKGQRREGGRRRGGGKRERSRADDRGGTGQGRKRRLEKREDG